MTPSHQNKPTDKTIKDAPLWLSLAIGTLLILIGLGIGYYTYSQNQMVKTLNEKGIKVNGIVSFVDRTGTKPIDRTYHYTISYSYGNNSYSLKTSFKYVSYLINEEVILLVNPDKPSQAMPLDEFNRETGSYLWTLFLIAMGVLIIYYKRKETAVLQKKRG